MLQNLEWALATFLAYFLVSTVSSSNYPVCPQKFAGEHNSPYVLYGKPSQCYVAGRQGPCSRGNVLFATPRSAYGLCSCECFMDEGSVFDDSKIRDYRYCFNARTANVFVHDKKRCNCYQLGTQGPCPQGQFLTKLIYSEIPQCVNQTREDVSDTPTVQRGCPPGTIYSELLDICTDMSFRGLSKKNESSSHSTTHGKCPPGTIYSELLKICTDMNFHGLSNSSESGSHSTTTGKCPPGTIYSTLLNICTDMNFHGLSKPNGSTSTAGKCPPGTIYSTLLNICTDMNFHGLRPPNKTGKCPPGTIYSTLLNCCTDMNFRGLTIRVGKNNHWSYAHKRIGKCPPGTIYSSLLNRCTLMNFRGLGWN